MWDRDESSCLTCCSHCWKQQQSCDWFFCLNKQLSQQHSSPLPPSLQNHSGIVSDIYLHMLHNGNFLLGWGGSFSNMYAFTIFTTNFKQMWTEIAGRPKLCLRNTARLMSSTSLQKSEESMNTWGTTCSFWWDSAGIQHMNDLLPQLSKMQTINFCMCGNIYVV